MYTREQRMTAISLLIKYDLCYADAIHELGYPDYSSLVHWYKDYLHEQATGILRPENPYIKYSYEDKEKAVKYYLEHGKNISRTIRAIGYPSRPLLKAWIDELSPKSRKTRTQPVKYSEEQKRQAVIDLCTRAGTAAAVAAEHGVNPASLYKWKRELLLEESVQMAKDNKDTTTNISKENSLSVEIVEMSTSAIKAQNEALIKRNAELLEQIKKLESEKYKKQLELDVLEKAVEIIKKDEGVSLKTLTNKEKTLVIDALRYKYPLKELLSVFEIAKSSYCYQEHQKNKPDKYVDLRKQLRVSFVEAYECYGYRRMYLCTKKADGSNYSEKVIRRLMHEEHLIVKTTKRRKYSSYQGEISPAVENVIQRDFYAENPNEKWLTDITEFHIPSGKVYLSPIIDCFDGFPVAWTIGTSPNAELVNTMLDAAIATLGENDHPIVHSDRGAHYRWPGWIERMENAKLTRSMSKKGYSPDNSACEGFFGRLKNELFYNRSWANVTIDEFMKVLDRYMHWYAEKRIKISLGGLSPLQYRQRYGIAI